MSRKKFQANKGQYIFCDICGQACYAWEATRLGVASGRPGLLVCPKDADVTDFGLVPYAPVKEQPIKWTRINHTNVANGAAPIDIKTTTKLGT